MVASAVELFAGSWVTAVGVPVKFGETSGAAPTTSATGMVALAVIVLVPSPLTYPVKVEAPVPPLITGKMPAVPKIAVLAAVTTVLAALST